MAEKDLPKDVEKKTKEFMEKKGFGVKTAVGRFFLEQNAGMSYLSGFLTAAGLFLYMFKQMVWPIVAWLGFYFLLSVIRMIYWALQVNRSEKELRKIEGDLKQLNAEIQRGKAYFDNLRDQAGISKK